ncbi:hypothetical protein PtrARCrB10_08463 [Pyrenophora tritici-repentis]|uniref:Fungal Zn binuclear cluster domain containing protein n=1 Tax=Pyrenophora tritici-repentis TaxID=45151 RepID=A0A317B2K8_9PLEO|nr:Fungal Zn binuclear cluster domain containing protein [Pyrenophora tritici-repentis]PWO23010.1 hypothetical protein PtrARCrB10_08463 [Pyrenophora tritici-repentis]
MPPKSQRSRACSQCRSRRVKCDETPEICNQCRRLGLTCSGPLQGSIVIDMTERVVKPRERRKKQTTKVAVHEKNNEKKPLTNIDSTIVRVQDKDSANKAATEDSLSQAMFPAQSASPNVVEKAITAIRYQYRPPQFNQPSRVLPESLDVAFLCHYVELNRSGETDAPQVQWFFHLPKLYENARKPAVRLSLRAVSMAFYGNYHHDPSILVDSWRWYTIALSAQRVSVEKLRRNGMPDEEEVLVPLILALYEIYVGASAGGSMAHLAASAEIMNMRGPSNCKTDAIWPIFKVVRSSDAHKCVVFNKKSIYSSPEWMTIPFIDMPPDPHQSLANIELMLPDCVTLLGIPGTMRAVFDTPIPPHVDTRSCADLAIKLLDQLDEWADTYPHLTRFSRSRETTPVSNSPSKASKNKARKSNSIDTVTALVASNYAADRLHLNSLMYKIHTQSTTPPESDGNSTAHYFDEAMQCGLDIMKAMAAIEQVSAPGLDLLRSIAPLVTVGFTAPDLELRNDAMVMMGRWVGRVEGLGAIFKHM